MPGLRAFEMRLICRAAAALALIAATTHATAGDCPTLLDDPTQDAECTLLEEATLESEADDADVVYRVYRRVIPGEDVSALYDDAPYDNTAVTLAMVGADAPFWAGSFELGIGWFEKPFLVRNVDHGELLVVPGRYTGTGRLVEDYVFLRDDEGWQPTRSAQSDPETGEGWVSELEPYLPEGHGVWKGVWLDYETLTGWTPVWRDDDANCCPTGGTLWMRLDITGDEPAMVVTEGRYTAPPGPGEAEAASGG